MDAKPFRMISHSLGVVARRHRDHPAPALFLRQREQLIESAPLLKGGGELLVLEFKEYFAARKPGQRP
jgi:hypothetical protein